jgi:hypothetical protein
MPSDDKTQISVQYAILAFCLTFMLLVVIFAIFLGGFVWSYYGLRLFIIFLISSVAAVGGFFAGKTFG